MPERLDVAVVGAGPYGLSVAAHLPGRACPGVRRADADVADADAAGHAACAPTGRRRRCRRRTAAGSIDVWAREAGEPREEPIPLQKFLRYADWFRGTFVPENDPSDVARARAGG